MGESLLSGLKVGLMAKQRVHILYKGRVQGVGFRFVAERVALQRSREVYSEASNRLAGVSK